MYFWGLVKKVVQQVEDLSFFLLFLLFYKKVKKSEKKYKKVFSTFPDACAHPWMCHLPQHTISVCTSLCCTTTQQCTEDTDNLQAIMLCSAQMDDDSVSGCL